MKMSLPAQFNLGLGLRQDYQKHYSIVFTLFLAYAELEWELGIKPDPLTTILQGSPEKRSSAEVRNKGSHFYV